MNAVLVEMDCVIREVVDRYVGYYFRKVRIEQVRWKDPRQVVTPADLAIEAELAARLPELVPGGVVAEERGADRAWEPGQATWIIDPIDGSAQFARGSTEFATTVALWQAERLEAAWIYAPARGQMWTARRGHGVRLNDAPLHRAGTGSAISVTADEYITSPLRRTAALLRARGLRVMPCQTVSLAYTRLATGDLAAAIYDWDSPWDHAAGTLLNSEAGLAIRHATGEHYDPRRRTTAPLVIAPAPQWHTLAAAVRDRH